MGLAIHSIPGLSAEPERVFSRYAHGLTFYTPKPKVSRALTHATPTQSSRILLSDRRNRLGDDVIEACKCLKAWEREGFLPSPEAQDMEAMLESLEERDICHEKGMRK